MPAPAFRLPEGLSIRYDPPAPDLAEAISAYHVYRANSHDERVDWFLGTGDSSVALDAPPITIDIRRRTYDPMPPLVLMGPQSQAMRP